MFKKTQSITLKDTCSPLSNNFAVFIDAKRNVGHYAVVSRNIVTISSSPLEGQSGAKPVNRPFVLRDPSARRISHIVQVISFLCGGAWNGCYSSRFTEIFTKIYIDFHTY